MRQTRTRIKWKKVNDTLIISEPMIVGSEIMAVFINIKSKSFLIRDVNQKYIFSAGKSDSLSSLKTLAKQKLVLMGAKFYDEIRMKGKKK